MNMKKEEQDNHNSPVKEGFVTYDPDNPSYERLYLCKYLFELPDLQEEDDPKTG
jgi:hypothetical protein